MTVPSEFRLWFPLPFRLWFRLRFTPRRDRIAGFPLGYAGLRGSRFFDISICTGNSL
jgi:hypothetical protein